MEKQRKGQDQDNLRSFKNQEPERRLWWSPPKTKEMDNPSRQCETSHNTCLGPYPTLGKAMALNPEQASQTRGQVYKICFACMLWFLAMSMSEAPLTMPLLSCWKWPLYRTLSTHPFVSLSHRYLDLRVSGGRLSLKLWLNKLKWIHRAQQLQKLRRPV